MTYVKSITMYMFPSSDCQATYHHITSKSEDLHLETAGIKETIKTRHRKSAYAFMYSKSDNYNQAVAAHAECRCQSPDQN